MPHELQRPHIVFDFIRSPSKRLAEIEAGEAPREMLLGYVQLKERGWPINTSDDRWEGILGNLRQRLVFRLEIPSFQMLKHWMLADIVVITTRISLILALTAKLLGKNLVFLDVMCEEVPKRFWRRWIVKLALPLSDACICLSSSQAKHWANSLKIPIGRFNPVFYGIDLNFYKPPIVIPNHTSTKPYLLAVGRDPRRDFNTLVSAANKLGWDLKLVTQHYLIPKGVRDNTRVQIFDGLSYEELFKLYANATVVVVPVRKGTTYMSGIRATMEAMCLGAPVVASSISGMQDYFTHGEELLYFEPENSESLLNAINILINDNEFKMNMIEHAKQKINQDFSLSQYVDSLEKILKDLKKRSAS